MIRFSDYNINGLVEDKNGRDICHLNVCMERAKTFIIYSYNTRAVFLNLCLELLHSFNRHEFNENGPHNRIRTLQ